MFQPKISQPNIPAKHPDQRFHVKEAMGSTAMRTSGLTWGSSTSAKSADPV